MKRITVRPLKSRQLIVLVDLDGVLLDFEKQFLRKFRAIYPDEPFIPCENRNIFDPAEQYAMLPNAADSIIVSIYIFLIVRKA
jgi:5'-nucleotidase